MVPRQPGGRAAGGAGGGCEVSTRGGPDAFLRAARDAFDRAPGEGLGDPCDGHGSGSSAAVQVRPAERQDRRACVVIVGWAERSETHHVTRLRRWVSLRSTHPTIHFRVHFGAFVALMRFASFTSSFTAPVTGNERPA